MDLKVNQNILEEMKLTTDELQTVKAFQHILKSKSEMTTDDMNFDGVAEDALLWEIISEDTDEIVNRARDKNYNIDYNKTEEFISDEYGCRSYCLTPGGGICIWCNTAGNPINYKIITIAEDDENYFIDSRNIYCSAQFDSKNEFLDCLSRAISLFNNNTYENN